MKGIVRIAACASCGVKAAPVDLQVQLSGGQAGLLVVGLPNKAVRVRLERVSAAFAAPGLVLSSKRAIFNLERADLTACGCIGVGKVARIIAAARPAIGPRRAA